MWESHCVQSRFLQELNIFTCQTESWGEADGYYCGGSDTTLDVYQNSLYSFVRLHMPTPYNIRTLRVETGQFYSLVILLKCSTSVKSTF